MEAQLVACVRESLDHFLYDNATFMCERLYAEYPSEENLLLLATVYFRADQAYRSYNMLTGVHIIGPRGLSPQARYLLAQCCQKLGRYDEAKNALLQPDGSGDVPGGAAGCYLLGKLHSLTDNPSLATNCYQAALIKDPLLWCAYEGLCQLGHNEDAAAILNHSQMSGASLSPSGQRQAVNQGQRGHPHQATPSSNLSAAAPAFVPSTGRGSSANRTVGAFQDAFRDIEQSTPSAVTSFVTPSPNAIPAQMPGGVQKGGLAGPRETPTATPLLRGPDKIQPGTNFNSDRWKFMDEGKLRKVSNRLFADPSSTGGGSPFVTTRRGSRAGASIPNVVEEQPHRPAQQNPGGASLAGRGLPLFTFKAGQTTYNGTPGVLIPEGGRSSEGKKAVLTLLQQIGEGYGLLCMYKCQEAIAAFERLSGLQYQTAWVMCQIGRAAFEMIDFARAASTFQRARQLDCCRLQGMEYYSTVLWHLKQEVELSHLAQEAIALDRLDPRSWCIIGNCFSLQKDQDAALKFFQRALQLDASFTYAYTLAGHENLALEQFDKSISCFRNAMRLDPRHYNAWYGLGQIYFRQEKYEMALYHFESSLKINGRSSILRCYMGMALAKLRREGEALAMLRQAISADPNNPLARFELANILVSCEEFDMALQELEKLKDMAPKEASVFFQIGKIFKRLNRTEQALIYYSTALDLKPSSADINLIKSAIEKLRLTEESDDEEM